MATYPPISQPVAPPPTLYPTKTSQPLQTTRSQDVLPMLEVKMPKSKNMDKSWSYTVEQAIFNGEHFELDIKIENPVLNYSAVQKFFGNSAEDFQYRIVRQIQTLNDFLKMYGVKGRNFKVDFEKMNEQFKRRRSISIGLDTVEAAPPRRRRKKNSRRKKK